MPDFRCRATSVASFAYPQRRWYERLFLNAIMDTILSFLRRLARNNNRDWFEKNKDKYLQAKETFEDFVTVLYEDLIKIDGSLTGLDPKKFIFRIYRDVRFSKDKKPYKTNFAAAFSATGKGLGSPGYYFHLEPGDKSFVAGGLFRPAPDNLAKVRQEIDYNAEILRGIINDKKFRRLFQGFWDGDKLKTIPRGYAADHPEVAMLKLRSFIMTHAFTDKSVTNRKFKNSLVNAFQTVRPLNLFLTEALS